MKLPWFSVALVVLNCSLCAFASSNDRTEIPPKIGMLSEPQQPFTTFRGIDQILTVVDRDNQALRSHSNATGGPRKQARSLPRLERSRELREISRSVHKLSAISSQAEALYRNKNQRYGALLFHQLSLKAHAMSGMLDQQYQQRTLTGFNRQQDRFSKELLAFVLQFQAISGGYAALACQPGGWACCQPRLVRQDGKTHLQGCSWQCASKARVCRDGCLGPRTPKSAAAMRPAKPKLSRAPTRDNSKLSGVSE